MVPGHVASKLLGLEPEDDEALARVPTRMHWAHGVTMGTVRAAISRRGIGLLAAIHYVRLVTSKGYGYGQSLTVSYLRI